MKKKEAKNIVNINVFTNDIIMCKYESETGETLYMPNLRITVNFPEIVFQE